MWRQWVVCLPMDVYQSVRMIWTMTFIHSPTAGCCVFVNGSAFWHLTTPVSVDLLSPPYPRELHTQIQPTADRKHIYKKIIIVQKVPESRTYIYSMGPNTESTLEARCVGIPCCRLSPHRYLRCHTSPYLTTSALQVQTYLLCQYSLNNTVLELFT